VTGLSGQLAAKAVLNRGGLSKRVARLTRGRDV
jgi:hypothetical protein